MGVRAMTDERRAAEIRVLKSDIRRLKMFHSGRAASIVIARKTRELLKLKAKGGK